MLALTGYETALLVVAIAFIVFALVAKSLRLERVKWSRRDVAVAEARTRAQHPALVRRCSSSHGLRTVFQRNRDSIALCPDCRRGEVIPRETFCDW